MQFTDQRRIGGRRSLGDKVENQIQRKENAEPSVSCTTCPERDTCTEPCDRVKAILPGVQKGRGRRVRGLQQPSEVAREIKMARLIDVFHQFEVLEDKIRDEQWVVVVLYYQRGMTQAAIASELGISRSAVSGRLVRARKKKEEVERARREEFFEHQKKKHEEDLE